MFARAYILISILLALSVNAFAQPYQFSQLGISSGLSHNQINCILKDKAGFMWFGTLSGLNRYDGYKFKVFKHNVKDSTSINDDNVINIQYGPKEKLWVQTRSGFVIYDPLKERFDRRVNRSLLAGGIKGSLLDIRSDGLGIFYFITSKGLYQLSPGSNKARLIQKSLTLTSLGVASDNSIWTVNNQGWVEQRKGTNLPVVYRKRIADASVYKIFVDKQDDVWVYSSDQPKGAFYISRSKDSIKHYTNSTIDTRLNNNNIYSISQDDKGVIWLGTDHGGINLLDKEKKTVSFLLNSEGDEKSIAQNSTPVIYKDNTGIMWVGTFKKGLSYYHESIIKFPLYRHKTGKKNTLPYDDVNRFIEDNVGRLWIGTNGGGLICWDRKKNTFKTYKHDPNNKNSLSNDVVVSLCIDHENILWIGTYFGGLDRFDGQNFKNFKHHNSDPSSLSDDRVWEIMEDSSQNLWIGTLDGGLDRFDRKTSTFKHFRAGGQNSVKSNYINALLQDRSGNIWIGTDNGIDVLMKGTGKFKHYNNVENNINSLSNDNVLSILQDSRGLIWLGTQDGLSIFDPGKSRFYVLRSTEGIADNTILTILEDNNHNIWLGTTKGVSQAIVNKKNNSYKIRFKNYDEHDGLQGLEFNENAAYRTRSGELIFGGANGFNLFIPDAIKDKRQSPPVVFTDFQLFNKSIKPEELAGKGILRNSISSTNEIELKYDQNVFSIEFAALNFSNAPKNRYVYILEGFNDKWLTADSKERKATFTNLDPGEYIFRVKAANDNGVWKNQEASLKITILPPFWKTNTAQGLYLFSILCFLYLLRQRGINKLKAQFALEKERQSAQQMHELDMMKIKFFTNVSHEFRTPLSLILAPLDKLLKQDLRNEEKIHLQLIQRNAKRLLNLVNQLMDFRKMEVKELKLQPLDGDIVKFVHESFQSFTDLAEKKNIRYTFSSELSSFITKFDFDKIERILFNLLSNAFKFTSEGGEISLSLSSVPGLGDASVLQIAVQDNGIGIALDKQDKIFERFFQNDVPGSMVNQGSGIGLSITKEFVNLHDGTIKVSGMPNIGSCFIVELPLVPASLDRSEEFDAAEPGLVAHIENLSIERNKTVLKKPTVLLIEDNDDFRFYLKDNLGQLYNIIESSNGKTGWNKALSLHPDLIVSDVSMPEMNGIDLCAKLRADKRTSHIPIILLTALMGEEQVLRGIETGANDYMTKPFNFEILLSKIKNLLVQQESLRKTYQKQVEVNPAEIEVQSADERFIQHALQIIEKNISNSDFTVEEFSKCLAMSRVALYKKLLQLTRQTPIEFIRSFRLKRAAQLLEKSKLTIAEVAYEAGFNNPKAFAKYFKSEFGVLPSTYIKTCVTLNKPVVDTVSITN